MKAIETPTPYEHVIVEFKLKMPGATRPYKYEKKGWYEPINNTYCVPREWESCSYGQRPKTLEGFVLDASEVIGWQKIKS